MHSKVAINMQVFLNPFITVAMRHIVGPFILHERTITLYKYMVLTSILSMRNFDLNMMFILSIFWEPVEGLLQIVVYIGITSKIYLQQSHSKTLSLPIFALKFINPHPSRTLAEYLCFLTLTLSMVNM